MRCASLFFVLLLLCKGLLANPAAPGLSVYYGAASQLGIGAISKAEAEISFGKLLSRKLRQSGIDLQLKVYDTSEQTLSTFRNGKANVLVTSAYEVAQVYDELDEQIFAVRFKHSSEKQRLLLIVRKDIGARHIFDLAGRRLILGRRGGVGEAFLSISLLRNNFPEAKDFFSEMQIGRYYLERREYIASMKRFRIVVENYSNTRHVEEALARLVEAYFAMGVVGEAQTAAAVLGNNYPDSQWYADSYKLLQTGGLEPRENKGSWISRAGKSLLGV